MITQFTRLTTDSIKPNKIYDKLKPNRDRIIINLLKY
ncbi:hypothetical protein PTD2_20017 [Pseudoalteromonas tunicata D2]|uniref:Uncharacterized protein n=1 Tax=Pseudoalteromonas tunicata D2 TaxID=87626 RepID=A4C9S9_9GAMM|nr:hypothetical protein PTD2_20017 [Pseudoalteromonas tunicata D2]